MRDYLMTNHMTKREQKALNKMKQHCLDRYERGYDTMVECWSDSDYLDTYREQGSLRAAITFINGIASIYRDRYADALNSSW